MTTINEQAQAYRKRLFPGFDSPLASTDPEFVERLDRFAFGEVPASDDLDDRTRMMAILASLVGAQAIDLFKAMAKARSTWASRRLRSRRSSTRPRRTWGWGACCRFCTR